MQLFAEGAQLLPGRQIVASLLLLAACSHGEPFNTRLPLSGQPLAGGEPLRLTYSSAEDRYPSWIPGQGSVLYNFVPEESVSGDRCLGQLPVTGGQRQASRCSATDPQDDSTDVYSNPAWFSSSQVAWLEQHGIRGRTVPDYGSIVVGSLDHRSAATRLVTLPYTSSTGNVHATITNLRWLSSTQLAYIGADMIVRAPCIGCPTDTVIVSKEVMLLSTTGGAPAPLANSSETTSIWPDANGTALYYTLGGDTRVFRRDLPTGTPVVVHDFGIGGIARDVAVAGSNLTAVVGGKVYYGPEALTGVRQVDSGGVLMAVDLTSGNETQLDIARNYLYRRPTISPDGHTIVVEGFDSLTPRPDLWRFALP